MTRFDPHLSESQIQQAQAPPSSRTQAADGNGNGNGHAAQRRSREEPAKQAGKRRRGLTDAIPFLPRLPQHDLWYRFRKSDLKDRQEDYEYDYDYVSPLAMCKDVPFRDEFSVTWMWEIGERLLTVLSNLMEVESDPYLRSRHEQNSKLFEGMKQAASLNIEGVLKVLQDAIEMGGTITRAQTSEEFATLFRTIGIPPIHRHYRDDEVFADLSVAGPNPVMLNRVDRMPESFPVSDKDFKVALPHDSLDAALREGRAYMADYRALEGLERSDFPCDKFLYAPLALYVVDKRTKNLAPVAIQCKQTPGEDNPIFTPNDGYNWLIAKTVVCMADGNVHEPVTHLARTHLFIEPFVMATERQLASWHPLGMLLRPHFEGTLHINDLAQKYLISDRGGVHRLCGGTIDSIRRAAVEGVTDYSFNDAMLNPSLKARGVDNKELLPNYPFRDDASLYWDAIHDWVRDYLSIYYKSPGDIQQDEELKAWYRELVSVTGGRVPGFGQGGQISTLEYLVEAVTMVIYTSSVQHAAVNFPQYELMGYPIAMPLAIYNEIPTSKTGATHDDFLKILPPIELANLQMCLGYGLGSLHYTELGEYSWMHFRDLRVRAPLKKFRRRIQEIGAEIEQRNQSRRPYNFLLPAGIPQSINI